MCVIPTLFVSRTLYQYHLFFIVVIVVIVVVVVAVDMDMCSVWYCRSPLPRSEEWRSDSSQ